MDTVRAGVLAVLIFFRPGHVAVIRHDNPAQGILHFSLVAFDIKDCSRFIKNVGAAIVFAVVIGLLMAGVFRKEEKKKVEAALHMPEPEKDGRPLWKTSLYFLCMILFLIFSDWYNPGVATVTLKDGTEMKVHVRYETKDTLTLQMYDEGGETTQETKTYARSEIKAINPVPSLTLAIHNIRWYLAGVMFLAILAMVSSWFSREEVGQWMAATWDFTKLLVPLLFGGVFIVGFISVFIPEKQVALMVGDNSLFSNFFASVVGAFFYFATLTEVPITEMLMKLGMVKGPALALLLAGPALSIPNMLVIRSIMGIKKTLVFSFLVVVMATITGIIFGYCVS